MFLFFHSFKHSNWWRQKLGGTEYLTQTYKILVLILYSKLIRNVTTMAIFNTN